MSHDATATHLACLTETLVSHRPSPPSDPNLMPQQSDSPPPKNDAASLTDGERYESFLQLFSQNRERLFAYVRSMLPHRVDAEDVFQRCSIVLWRKFEHYDGERDFMAWACGVAYFEVKNFLRVAARDHLQFSETLIEQLAEQRSQCFSEVDHRMEALKRCLSKLDGVDRDLVKCAYDDSRSLADFAATTGRAVQSLYNRLSLLRKRLHECVEKQLSTEGLTP